MRQRRVAAGYGLSTGLRTTIKYVRRTASGAEGNGLGTTIKYLRGTAGIGLGPTTKYRAQCFCVETELPLCVDHQIPHQNKFPFASAAQNSTPKF
jgi:hypothetical protein